MAQPLSYSDATHLLRRATARGRKAEAQHLSQLGLEAAVDLLLQPAAPPKAYTTSLTRNERGKQHQEIIRLWVDHWLTTPTPAAERLTLFWHGHFTSEFRETNRAQGIDFLNQFATFRKLGYKAFGELLKAVAKDPVMLLYLNNADSRKEHPNENWARELLELYTVGPGHYSEADILEAARAFTGWSVRLSGSVAPANAPATTPMEFLFRPRWYDDGPKRFLGQSLKTGDEVLEVLIAHPKTYEFVGRKLLRFYLSPEPPESLVQEAAAVLRKSGTQATLRWLFTHPEFYSPKHRSSLVKSPLEYVVGLLYAAGQTQLELGNNRGGLGLFAAMGQIPFDPPNVSGWEGGLSWLAESPLLARLNLVGLLAGRERQLDLEVFMDGGQSPLALVRPEAQLL